MLPEHFEQINPGDNVIIALGDSFTQGCGAYTNESWKKSAIYGKGNSFNLSGTYFRDEQAKFNWAAQMRDTYLPDYKVWNLGINGGGNRATVKELYLNPAPKNLGNVVVILMATGMERFDFLKNSDRTSGPNNHQKWQTIWPIHSDRGESISIIEKAYADILYSNQVIATEFLLNVAEAQTFCRANGYRFVFTTAFDTTINKTEISKMLARTAALVDIVNWDDFVLPSGSGSVMEMIIKLEDHPKVKQFLQLRDVVQDLVMPLQYITPCMHWTIEGQAEAAKFIAASLRNKNII